MDNAKKLSPISWVSVRVAENRWSQGAEKSGFGTGPTKGVAFAIRGGKTKRSGTALGKTNFQLIGRKSSTLLKAVNDTSLM